MRLTINHTTRYRFDGPVSHALHQARLRPKSTPGQDVVEWTLDIEGGRTECSFVDQHGSLVDLISAETGGSELVVTCRGQVETSDTSGMSGRRLSGPPLWYYLRQTALTEVDIGIRLLLEGLDSESDSVAQLHALSSAISEKVEYLTGQTDAQTTAEEALQSGAGVCQDHAHVFVAAARTLGFPARYVSGYLMMNDRIDQDATHAWAETYIDGIGWTGFDVSNRISPDSRYVRLATGLDYSEAAPIRGIVVGPNTESMLVSVQVQQ